MPSPRFSTTPQTTLPGIRPQLQAFRKDTPNPAAVNNQAVLVQILAELKRLNERVEKLEKQRSDN